MKYRQTVQLNSGWQFVRCESIVELAHPATAESGFTPLPQPLSPPGKGESGKTGGTPIPRSESSPTPSLKRSESDIEVSAAPPSVDFGGWETVTLPHTPRIEPAYVQFPWQGICWYRREIHSDPSWRGRRVSLVFGA